MCDCRIDALIVSTSSDPVVNCTALFHCCAVVSVLDIQDVNPDDGDRSDTAEADRAETEGGDQLTAADSGR